MAVSISAQHYGERIGRRNSQSITFETVSSPETKIGETNVSVASRAAWINSGYSYIIPPTNPLLLPSSSNQQDHQVNFAIAAQPIEVVEQQLEEDAVPLEIQEIEPEQSFPVILADHNSLVPVHQQQPIDEEIAFWDFRESIPGEPEFDYPILDKIPKTLFKCTGRQDGNLLVIKLT